jgi:menaquinol-cytochrome c reductase cytochrome b/c subunit
VAPAGGAAAAVATAAPPPTATGPAGHTQRLLTVVKAGSIQDVKAAPQDKVHVWPHLLAIEFVASLFMTAFLLVFSIFVNAPLLELANPNETPNPSKAPWYFLGLQELLTMFHPMVAGVTIPGMGIFLLILAPYMDRNPSNKPEDRKFAIAVFTVQLILGRAGDDRLVLPWSRSELRGPVGRGPVLRAVIGPVMSYPPTAAAERRAS